MLQTRICATIRIDRFDYMNLQGEKALDQITYRTTPGTPARLAGQLRRCRSGSHRQRVTTPYFTDRVFPLFPPGLRGFPSGEGDREGAATGTHLGTFSKALQD